MSLRLGTICRSLFDSVFGCFGQQTLQQITDPANNLAATLKQISEFTLGGGNPKGQRDQLLNTVRAHYEKFLLALIPYLAYLTLKSAQVQQVITQSQDLLAESQKQTRAILDELEQRRGEAESIVRATQDAAAKIGVAQFAVRFVRRSPKSTSQPQRGGSSQQRYWVSLRLVLRLDSFGGSPRRVKYQALQLFSVL